MRKRLVTGLFPFLLLTAAVGAAEQYTRTWLRVAPDEEEFAVLMPEVNFRVRREIPFERGLLLRPVSYEVTNRGVFFSVLSFPKSGTNAPQSLGEFVKGFGRALAANERRAPASFDFTRELKLEGRNGREFKVRVGDSTGTARAYEAAEHYYLVLAIGHPSGAASVELFQESFSFNRSGPMRVTAQEPVEVLMQPIPAPAPLWPFAGSGALVLGDRDPGAPAPQERRVSGGIMTGKALHKTPPAYPAIAKAARAQGPVVVQITVDEEGYVIQSAAVSGHPLLQQAAAVALRQWRFSPTTVEGQPVKVTGTVSVNFTLK